MCSRHPCRAGQQVPPAAETSVPGVEEDKEGPYDLQPCLEPAVWDGRGVIDRRLLLRLAGLILRAGFLVHTLAGSTQTTTPGDVKRMERCPFSAPLAQAGHDDIFQANGTGAH